MSKFKKTPVTGLFDSAGLLQGYIGQDGKEHFGNIAPIAKICVLQCTVFACPDSALTEVPWNNPIYDPYAMHTGSNTTIVPPSDTTHVRGTYSWSFATAVGNWQANLMQNHLSVIGGGAIGGVLASLGFTNISKTCAIIPHIAGASYGLDLYQDTGAPLAIGDPPTCWFMLEAFNFNL